LFLQLFKDADNNSTAQWPRTNVLQLLEADVFGVPPRNHCSCSSSKMLTIILRHIGLGQMSCSCCKLTFLAAPPRKFFVPAATSADYDLDGTCLGQTSCCYFKLTFWDLLRRRRNVARYNKGQTVDVAQQQRWKHIGNTRLRNCQRPRGYQRHIDLAKPMTIWGLSSRLDAVVEDLF